jgi:hypothetical protein
MGCGDAPPAVAPPASPPAALALEPVAVSEIPPEPLPPGAIEEPCVHTVDAQGRHVIAATHADPTLSLAELAQVRALGRIRLDTSDLTPPGRYRYMAVAPIFVDSGRIAVRCDFSVKGTAWYGGSGYSRYLPVVTSVIFFVRPGPAPSSKGSSSGPPP